MHCACHRASGDLFEDRSRARPRSPVAWRDERPPLARLALWCRRLHSSRRLWRTGSLQARRRNIGAGGAHQVGRQASATDHLSLWPQGEGRRRAGLHHQPRRQGLRLDRRGHRRRERQGVVLGRSGEQAARLICATSALRIGAHRRVVPTATAPAARTLRGGENQAFSCAAGSTRGSVGRGSHPPSETVPSAATRQARGRARSPAR